MNFELKTAGDVKIGDSLVNKENQLVPVKTIEHFDEIVTTYNFDVEEYDTFYAEGAYLVHNADPTYTTTPIEFAPKKPCFLAGTKVLMADNSYKNIEDVAVGDKVLSYDKSTGSLKPGKVAETQVHENVTGYLIINNVLVHS